MTYGFDPSQGLIIVPVRLFGPAGDMNCTLGFGHRGYEHIDKLGNHGPLGIRSSNITRPNSGDHWKRG